MRNFFLGCKDIIYILYIFAPQVSFCPVQRGNRVGSYRNESDYSRKGTQTSFPLFESRSCENFGLDHFQFSCNKKNVDQTESPFCLTAIFLTRKSKNELLVVRILVIATLPKRDSDLGTSPRVVKLIPRRAGSISSIYGPKLT